MPQVLLDKSTPHLAYRWVALAALLLLYAVRVYFLKGYAGHVYAKLLLGVFMELILQSWIGMTPHAAAAAGVLFGRLLPFCRPPTIAAPASEHAPCNAAPRPPCSFYIVTYALAIYILNLLLGFLRWAGRAAGSAGQPAGAQGAAA